MMNINESIVRYGLRTTKVFADKEVEFISVSDVLDVLQKMRDVYGDTVNFNDESSRL